MLSELAESWSCEGIIMRGCSLKPAYSLGGTLSISHKLTQLLLSRGKCADCIKLGSVPGFVSFSQGVLRVGGSWCRFYNSGISPKYLCHFLNCFYSVYFNFSNGFEGFPVAITCVTERGPMPSVASRDTNFTGSPHCKVLSWGTN